ncbi:MAG: IS1380 family transposase [Actinomycetota bacterium]
MKGNAVRPRVHVRADAQGCVSMAGAQLLVETARVSGVDAALSAALDRWRKPRAVHDPGKIFLDLALTLAVGGDCPADAALLRAGGQLFGPVASASTICRLVDDLAEDLEAALAAMRSARAEARAWVRHLTAGQTTQAGEVLVDIDATLVTAHSEKQDAAPTYKRGFGFHPLMAYLDHGPDGTGEGLAGLLRPGNANAGAAADHLAVLDLVTDQLTADQRGRLVIRTDTAACTHAFLAELNQRGFGYSVGFYARADVAAAIGALTPDAWIPAIDADGVVRDGAWVAELTPLLNLSGWPDGMRVIARKERPHPGAQLRLTDVDGHRITCFATNRGASE